VAYLNGSKVLTTGSALTFDGTTLTSTQASPFTPNATFVQTASVSGVAFVKVQSNSAEIDLMSGGATYAVNYMGADEAGLVTQGADGMRFNVGGSYARWTFGGTEGMRLTSTGLGIGTSSPAGKVHASNSYSNSSDLSFVAEANIPGLNLRSSTGGRLSLATGYIGANISSLLSATGTSNPSDELMRFNHSSKDVSFLVGNLGLGVTPSAWASGYKALDAAAAGTFSGTSTGVQLWANAVDTSTGSKYKNTAAAGTYQISGATHAWYTAPSGTAGNAISFTQAMTLDASGRLLVGCTTGAQGRLAISGSGGTTSSGDVVLDSNASYSEIQSYNSKPLYINRQGNNVLACVEGGGLGVGNTSPIAKLDVLGGNARVALAGGSASTLRGYEIASGTAVFASVKAESTTGELRVDAGFSGFGGYSTFYTNGTERARIDSSGNLLVGSTNNIFGSGRGGVTGVSVLGGQAVYYFFNSSGSTDTDASPVLGCYKESATTSSSARFVQFYASGQGTPMGGIVGNGASNVQFASISDAREKTNIAPISGSLEKVVALRPVEFDWIANGEHCPAGFVAQDVEQVFPEFVVENMANDGEETRKGLTGGMTGGIVAHLVKAIQEQQALIQTLTARVAALESN
jgi:hypothetical protein